MFKRKKLKIQHACSYENSIVFYSKRHKNYVSIATIDELGNVESKWVDKCYIPQDEEDVKKSKKIIFFIFLPIITFIAILITVNYNKNPLFSTRSFLLGEAIVIALLFVFRDQSISTRKFHSAEHMVANAYNKLNRIPSLEETKMFSRFHNCCGITSLTFIIIRNLLLFLCTFLPSKPYIIIGALSVSIISLLLKKLGVFNFMQFFSTLPPTDRELLVGIEALKTWLENEQNF